MLREISLYLYKYHLDQDIGHFHHLDVSFMALPVNTYPPPPEITTILTSININKFYLP